MKAQMGVKQSRTARITFSCTPDERQEILRQSAAWPSISDFLVHAAIPDRDAFVKFGTPTEVDLDTIRRALASGGIPAGYLERLPKELREAVSDYRSAIIRARAELEEGDRRIDFTPYTLKYPPTDEADLFQVELLREIVGLHADFGERTESPGGRSEEAHFVRPGLVTGRRVIYTYPFFRHPARRPYWGVLSYLGAHHVKIGLLLHKDTFSQSLSRAVGNGPSAYGWLGLAIDELCRANPGYLIGFRESFFEEEAAEVMWSRAQSQFKAEFEVRRRPILRVSRDEVDEKTDGTPTKVRRNRSLVQPGAKSKAPFFTGPQLKEMGIRLLVFDLFQKKEVCEAAGAEWSVVEFPHDIEVPVGIGFSLSFLPRLLLHDNWKRLAARAEALLPPLREQLQNCGIIFD